MKICTICGLNLPNELFRYRIDKRCDPPLKYLNSRCTKCENERGKHYHNLKKNDLIFKERNRQRAKKWSSDNKEYISDRMREKRQTEEYKEYVRLYYEKNHDKIRVQASKVNDKYIREQRDKITDTYAIILLCHPRNGITRDMVTKEMIELKKIEVAIDRLKTHIKKYEQKN